MDMAISWVRGNIEIAIDGNEHKDKLSDQRRHQSRNGLTLEGARSIGAWANTWRANLNAMRQAIRWSPEFEGTEQLAVPTEGIHLYYDRNGKAPMLSWTHRSGNVGPSPCTSCTCHCKEVEETGHHLLFACPGTAWQPEA